MYKVGDHVGFKDDVEGSGVIVEIKRAGKYDWGGDDFIIAVTEPGSCRAEQVHPMAHYSNKHQCMVVMVDDDHIWSEDW